MPSSIRTRTRTLRALAAALSFGLALPVTAQSAPPAPTAAPDPAPENLAAARQQFLLGREAYDLGRFEDALRFYEEAYRLDPRPATLFNIAQCHRHLGNDEKAAFSYRRFLDLGAPDPKTAALARELLAEVEGRLAQQKPPADAPVQLAQPSLPYPEAPLLEATAPPAQEPARTKLTQKWWFWAGAGVAVLAAGTGVALAVSRPEPQRETTLEPADLR